MLNWMYKNKLVHIYIFTNIALGFTLVNTNDNILHAVPGQFYLL